MIKLMLVPFFFLLTISPTFAAIEFRDTTHIQLCDTIIYNKGIMAVVKILSITNTHVTYKPCDDSTSKSYTVKRTYINDIKSRRFPKASASYEANLYKNKAKKALRTVLGILGVFTLLLFLYAISDKGSSFASLLLILAGFFFIGLLFSIIYYIYLWLKAVGKNQLAKVSSPAYAPPR
jgi:hypothetical protein